MGSRPITIEPNFKHNGCRRFLKAARFVWSKLFQYHHLILFQLDLNRTFQPVSPVDGVSVRMCRREDVLSMNRKDHDFDEKAKRYVLDRMDRGDFGLLALHDNRIIGYAWMMKGFMELTQGRLLPVSKDRRYMYKVFVAEEWRGKRILARLDEQIINMLKNDGACSIITCIDQTNISCRRARDRMGFRAIGNMRGVTILGITFNHIAQKDREAITGISRGHPGVQGVACHE